MFTPITLLNFLIMNDFDYKIDLLADIQLVAKSIKHELTHDQQNTIADKIFNNYSFNEWIEELIEGTE